MINLVLILLFTYVITQVPRFVKNAQAKRSPAAEFLYQVLTGNFARVKVNPRVKQIKDEISRLTTEAEALNSTNTFAKHSKCLRQIAKLQQEYEKLGQDTPEPSTAKAVLTWQATSVLLGFAFMFQYEKTGIAPDSLWPLDCLMGTVSEGSYNISLFVWYFMCLFLSYRLT